MATAQRSQRQGAILEILRSGSVHTQEQLAAELRQRHIEATQATISRDLRRMGVARLAGSDGPRYLPPLGNRDPHQRLAAVLAEQLERLDSVGSMLVLHTPIGAAQVVAAAIDAAGLAGVVGTVAGDDTLFIQTLSAREARAVQGVLEELRAGGRRWE